MSSVSSDDEVFENVEDEEAEAIQSVPSAIDILFETKKFSDVVFVVGENGDEVKAHKIILMSRSQVFEAMFSQNWNGESENRIQITDSTPNTFAKFIEYLYKSEIEISDPHGLVYLGDKYDVPDLIKSCAKVLLNNPNPRNFAHNFKLSTSIPHGLEAVGQKALQHFLTHMDLIVQTPGFYEMEMDLLVEIAKSDDLCSINEHTLFGIGSLIKWGSEKCRESGKVVNGTNLRSVLDPVIPYVRFTHMTGSYLATDVAQHGVLTHEEMLSIFYYKANNNDKNVTKFITDLRHGAEGRSCGAEIEYDDDGMVIEGGDCQCTYY